MRVAWTLEELGLDYETVAVSSEQCVAGEHLARHPLGRVPALERADGQILLESTAIVLAIADMHPQAGLNGPLGSMLRGQVYEWCHRPFKARGGNARRPRGDASTRRWPLCRRSTSPP